MWNSEPLHLTDQEYQLVFEEERWNGFITYTFSSPRWTDRSTMYVPVSGTTGTPTGSQADVPRPAQGTRENGSPAPAQSTTDRFLRYWRQV